MSSSTQSPATTAARLPSLYQFFGPGGLLARTHPAYEFRRGQLQMAEAVEQALAGAPPPDRRSWHRHRQDPGVSAAGHSLRQARHHLHRHEEPAGAALLQRRSVPATAPGRAARLLHEGTQQLSLPQEALRPDRPAGAERAGRDQPVPRSSATGRRRPKPAIAPNWRICRRPATLWPKLDARTDRCIGSEVPAVRPLLHHRDAPPRARERHHHRQPSPLLRRPGDQGGAGRCARCRRAARCGGGDLRRSARTGRRGRQLLRRDRLATCAVDDLRAMWRTRCARPNVPVGRRVGRVSAACASARNSSFR